MSELYQDFLYNYEMDEKDGTANVQLIKYCGEYIPIYYKDNGAMLYNSPKYIPVSELQTCFSKNEFFHIISYLKKRSIVIIYNDIDTIDNPALNRILIGAIKAYIYFFISYGYTVFYESK